MQSIMIKRGFTLIELMIVVSVIGLVLSLTVFGFQRSRASSRDAKRKADLETLKSALVIYKADNGVYPSTGGAWWGVSVNGGSRTTSGANAYIPGLTPNYIGELPTDPLGNTSGWSGYLYRSNGQQFKILSHSTGPESFPAVGQPYYDPIRSTWAIMVCSAEPACSNW